MDIFVLNRLKEEPMIGYDVISLVHDKLKVLVSSGTIYAMLYSMERQGLIQGTEEAKKRVYGLTEKGHEAINKISVSKNQINKIMTDIFED